MDHPKGRRDGGDDVYTPPFLLLGKDGSTRLFDTLDELGAAVRGRLRRVGVVFAPEAERWCRWTRRMEPVPGVDWVVRDLFGVAVPPAALCAPVQPVALRMRDVPAVAHAQRMGLPVPFTGKRGRFLRHLRRFAHVGAARAGVAERRDAREENRRADGRARPGRAGWHDPWTEEHPVPARRSWKHQRRTRWR